MAGHPARRYATGRGCEMETDGSDVSMDMKAMKMHHPLVSQRVLAPSGRDTSKVTTQPASSGLSPRSFVESMPLTRQTLSSLQRSVGNRAVGRVMQAKLRSDATEDRQAKGETGKDDKTLESEAGRTAIKALQKRRPPQIILAPTGRSTNVVQRKVGFEFEEQEWRAWIDRPGVGPRPAKRQEVLHRGKGFELQADDTLGIAEPTLEFVTKPFDPTTTGLQELQKAMSSIKQIMQTIGPFRRRDETRGQYVRADEHHLSNPRVRLSRGHSQGQFKMQATQGISLEDLPTLLQYIGANVPGETPAEQKDRSGARALMRGSVDPGDAANVLGSGPALADTAIARIVNHESGLTQRERQVFTANIDRLRGFLSQVMIYVKMLAVPNQSWAKYRLPLLARTDFAAMFMLLPKAQRTMLSQNNAQALVDAVIHAANSVALIPSPSAGHIDVGFLDNGPLLRNYRPQAENVSIMQSLTISAWLRGISGSPLHGEVPGGIRSIIAAWFRRISGSSSVDYLTPKNIQSWLNVNEAHLSLQDRIRQSRYLESLSSMKGITNAHDRNGASRLVILENRSINPVGGIYAPYYGTISPGKMSHEEMEKAARDYLHFFILLKAGGGNPGPFPNT